jgi:hypothetical protein
LPTIQVHPPKKEKEKRNRVVKQKRTWTYEDDDGNDLGQDYVEKLKSKDQQKINQEKNVR